MARRERSSELLVGVASVPKVARGFSPKPQFSFGYLLRETARSLDRSISRGLAAFGLTVSQYHLLRELWELEGLTVRELAIRVNIAEPSTLMTLYKMQQGGLVKMRTDKSDRRKRCIFLDTKGMKLKEPVLREIERVSTQAYSKINRTDLQAAVRVFNSIETNLAMEDNS